MTKKLMYLAIATALSITPVPTLSAAQTARTSVAAAFIARQGDSWTLANASLKSVVEFKKGSVDITSLRLATSGTEFLTGQGKRCLFRHTIDGKQYRADDGGWQLKAATINPIIVRTRTWGKELRLQMKRAAAPLSITLVIELYDGSAGLRYYSLIKNEDESKEMMVESSDVLALNLPDKPHDLWYVPWQTSWSHTEGSIAWGKRQCIVRYKDSGEGWALVPENNWCTSLKGNVGQPGSGDPKHPFMYYNAWGNGSKTVAVSTDPVAVQLVLFPKEQVEYFSVNLQLFAGDEWDGRFAVEQHLRSRFKYADPQPSLDFQEFHYEWLQNDEKARNLLIPALSEAGFDRWEVTWMWNGAEGDDRVEPKPAFTNDLPALAVFCLSKGVKIGFYNTMNGAFWGKGRDLADPKAMAWKQKQIEDVTIGRYHSTWQMIDLGELWKNEETTTYSHASDNVYRKYLALRNYMTDVTRRHPGWTPLTTCELECPPSFAGDAQCVSLMIVGESGQAGSYCRTDNRCGTGGSPRFNLSDAFNYYGLFPLPAYVGCYGDVGGEPCPDMFTPACYYGTLFAGCSTFYSDVRKWTTEQKSHMRIFNDWRHSPRIHSMLGNPPRPITAPLIDGEQPGAFSPFAWMYADDSGSQAMLVAVGHGLRRSCQVKLRGLDPKKTYWIEDITLGAKDFEYKCVARVSGRTLMEEGLYLDLAAHHGADSICYWLQAETGAKPQVLYAEPAVQKCEQSGSALSLSGPAGRTARVVVAKPGAGGVENLDVQFGSNGRASANLSADSIDEKAPTTPPVRPQSGGTAMLQKTEPITNGDWAGRFGKTAAWIAGADDFQANQHGFRFSAQSPVWTWSNEIDERTPVPAVAGGPRSAACWFADSCLTLSVEAPDSKPYRLTLYVMDYDRTGRREAVSLVDNDGMVLDTQTAEPKDTAEGATLSWTVSGSVVVELQHVAGLNAVASAVFIDAD